MLEDFLRRASVTPYLRRIALGHTEIKPHRVGDNLVYKQRHDFAALRFDAKRWAGWPRIF